MRSSLEEKKQADMQQGGLDKRDAVRDTSAFDTFDRMVNRIENNEAEIEARQELAGTSGQDVERELQKELESHSADAALDALKAKMSGGAAADKTEASPAPSDPQAKAIEDELASLRAKLDGDG